MRINTNSGAINADRTQYKADRALSQALEKLSSGLRINRASDDPAGLGVSESLRAQHRGLAVNERNIQDGLGFVQTADAALSSISDILQRMRELAVQSANGTVSNTQRQALDLEAAELSAEIDRIGTSTIFNGQNVFTLDPRLQVGPNRTTASNTFLINLRAVTSAALPGINAAGATANTNVSAAGVNLTTRAAASTEIGQFDTAITRFHNYRAQVGAIANRLESMLSTVQATRENITAAESRIRDTDLASAATALARGQIVAQSATAMRAQANLRPQMVLSLLQMPPPTFEKN